MILAKPSASKQFLLKSPREAALCYMCGDTGLLSFTQSAMDEAAVRTNFALFRCRGIPLSEMCKYSFSARIADLLGLSLGPSEAKPKEES